MSFKSLFLSALLLFLWDARSFAEAPAKGPEIRVLVAESKPAITLSVKGGYEIRLLPSMELVKKGSGLKNAVFSVDLKGVKWGQEVWPASGVRITPDADNSLFINKSRFRGSFEIAKWDNALSVVNRLPMESYLYGVLHHEVSPWWPMEALKAQAIAARTYAFYQIHTSKAQRFDVKSTTSSQVYGGSTTERFRSKRAVDKTAAQVLAYEGKVFPAYFHATCAGTTAAASELWKISVKPLGGGVRCEFCKISPHYNWRAKVPLAEIEEKMLRYSRSVGRILSIEAVSQTPSRRVGSLKITGISGEAIVAAKDFRIWVGGDRMRSTRFTVFLKDDLAEFKGQGWGHGVGLCQWGMLGQALAGRKAEDILKKYYPGASVQKI